MRAIVILRRGSPVAPNVQLVSDAPEPSPGPGEALVRTEAAALNHLDLWVGMGLPGIQTPYPFISGSDGAGIVARLGEGVSPHWLGKRVYLNAAVVQAQPALPGTDPAGESISMIGEHTPGALAEFFTAPVSNLQEIGDTDPIQAAAFGLSFLTAWRMLVTRARVRCGNWVLIPGIGGGVALACLAIARHFGCRTIVTSRHQEKLARAAHLGADHGILDDGSDFSARVRQHTGRRGVDIVADSVGKAVHGACLKSLCRGGVFVTCGCTTGGDPATDLTRIFWNQLSILGSTMGDSAEFSQVTRLLVTERLSPVVDVVLPPTEAAEAFGRLEAGTQFGKVVIDWRR